MWEWELRSMPLRGNCIEVQICRIEVGQCHTRWYVKWNRKWIPRQLLCTHSESLFESKYDDTSFNDLDQLLNGPFYALIFERIGNHAFHILYKPCRLIINTWVKMMSKYNQVMISITIWINGSQMWWKLNSCGSLFIWLCLWAYIFKLFSYKCQIGYNLLNCNT